jgi:hypothetical protein
MRATYPTHLILLDFICLIISPKTPKLLHSILKTQSIYKQDKSYIVPGQLMRI